MIFQSFDQFLVCRRPLRWHSATICDVITEQLSHGTVHKFRTILLFMKIYLVPSTFILGYINLKAKMILHTFMIKLDQPDY